MSNFKQQASRGTKWKADLVFTAEDLFCGVEVRAERRKTKSGFTEHDVYTPILPQSGSTSATPVSASDPPPPKIAVETCAAYIPDLHEDALEGTVKKVTEVKDQAFYLKQFVNHVPNILSGLMCREGLHHVSDTIKHTPDTEYKGPRCEGCPQDKVSIGGWRCRDCLIPTLLCRSCIRRRHTDTPLHRLEMWNGFHFRRASMWEVGGYVFVKHCTESPQCPRLQYHQRQLNSFQEDLDITDHGRLESLFCDETRQQGDLFFANARSEHFGAAVPDLMENHPLNSELFTKLKHAFLKTSNDEDDGEHSLPACGDDDDDYDITEDTDHFKVATPPNGALPQPSPDIPSTDFLNNQYVHIVDTNGVHHLPLVYCSCRGENQVVIDLMYAKLVPTTFSWYTTFFTEAVLDDFRLTNLECKASAYQYWQKLHQISASSISEDDIPDLYRELRRLSRCWRWVKKLKWQGYGQSGDDPAGAPAGSLAIFCPTCPQPGVNLPPDWESEPNRLLFMRSFVADGNFKADHVRLHRASEDIWLSPGSGMMASQQSYTAFLRSQMLKKINESKAPCNNTFRVLEAALLSSKACDVTGIVAIACARHGCFAPNSLTNLSHGERQVNVDWALLKALETTNMQGIKQILFIYDIVCQYIIKLRERIGDLLPLELAIERAIGLMHVHGHQIECFFCYAPSFIPGAGVVAGEILESLWSNLNAISPSTRTATLAHRAEVLDDHMNDSNHKKLLNMPTSLCLRLRKACEMRETAVEYFNTFVAQILEEHRKTWDVSIKTAEGLRINDCTVMDIMKANITEVQDNRSLLDPATLSRAEHSVQSPEEQFISLGIEIEERQFVKQLNVFLPLNFHFRIWIQDATKRLLRNPYEDARKQVESDRQKLQAQLATLERSRAKISFQLIPIDIDVPGHGPCCFDEHAADAEEDTDETDNHPTATFASRYPEDAILNLPSRAVNQKSTLQPIEVIFRTKQAHTLLQRTRDLICEKSFIYSHVVRNAPRKGVATRARAALAKLNSEIATVARTYMYARAALLRLCAPSGTLSIFKVLTHSDLKASTAILDPNQPGSTTTSLSWIWCMNEIRSETEAARTEFNRVHYLRARARMNRWEEEYELLQHEMDWTSRFFKRQFSIWIQRAYQTPHPGARAHALRKASMWAEFKYQADSRFKDEFPPFIAP